MCVSLIYHTKFDLANLKPKINTVEIKWLINASSSAKINKIELNKTKMQNAFLDVFRSS